MSVLWEVAGVEKNKDERFFTNSAWDYCKKDAT
jgi:hypothetical protein